jgi:hypothetical protein
MIRFFLLEDLPGGESTEKYYIYYSNPNRTNGYDRGTMIGLDWPLKEEYDSTLISYTRQGEHWTDGRSSTRDAKASFQFYGPHFRALIAKGPDLGIIEIQVDSKPWERIDLYNPLAIGQVKTHPYKFSTLNSNSKPADGYLKFDNDNIANILAIYISNKNSESINMLPYFNALSSIGGEVKIQYGNDSLKYAIFNLERMTNNTGYFILYCTYVSGNITSFIDNSDIKITFTPVLYTATGLGEGMHEVRIRVTGEKNPSSSGNLVRMGAIEYKKHSVGLDLGEEQYERLGWGGSLIGV